MIGLTYRIQLFIPEPHESLQNMTPSFATSRNRSFREVLNEETAFDDKTKAMMIFRCPFADAHATLNR
ncbi:MAG: hypothetical protein CMI30_06030 [Opitutae bacterium]|nr:hypothetical protein [Opitutae bacterium]